MAVVVAGPGPFGVADVVLSGFIRVVTHPRVFTEPTPLDRALAFCGALRDQPNAVVIAPGERHWQIFTQLCESANARGNLVHDAYLAALATESGSTWATANCDYSRFPGSVWRTSRTVKSRADRRRRCEYARMKRTTVSLPDDLAAAVSRAADRRRVSVSELTRERPVHRTALRLLPE